MKNNGNCSEAANSFLNEITKLQTDYNERLLSGDNQIFNGSFDDIFNRILDLKKRISDYKEQHNLEKKDIWSAYTEKLKNISNNSEGKSLDEMWEELKEIKEAWISEYKGFFYFDAIESYINSNIAKAVLEILESQAQKEKIVNLYPVDEVCSKDDLLQALKDRFIQKASEAVNKNESKKYSIASISLTKGKLGDPKVWELLVGTDSIKVEQETYPKKKNISKFKNNRLFERFRGKTIYTFEDPETGELEEVRGIFPKYFSEEKASRLIKIEINGVKSVKYQDFNKRCPGVYLDSQPYIPKYKNLQEVVLGDDVKDIDMWTFCDHKKLKNVKFGTGLEYIPEGAFKGSGVEKIEIPGNIKRIEGTAFKDCKSLTDVKLEEGVEEIGSECFAGCASLKSISPIKHIMLDHDSLRVFSRMDAVKIGEGKSETIFTFGDKNEKTEDWTNFTKMSFKHHGSGYIYFSKCPSDITARVFRVEINSNRKIPFGVFSKKNSPFLDKIQKYVFKSDPGFDNCDSVFENLQEVVIGDGVKEISNGAFAGNKNLKRVVFEKIEDVKEVGMDSFCHCSPIIVTSDGVEISLKDYLDCFNRSYTMGRDDKLKPNGSMLHLNIDKLKSLISNNRKIVQNVEECEENQNVEYKQNVDEKSSTQSVFSKKQIDSIASEKDVAIEDENSGEVIKEIVREELQSKEKLDEDINIWYDGGGI